MANKQFNSVDGYSVGGNANISVIDTTANITAAALTANGNVSFTGANVSLGSVSNLKITGGSSAYLLSTDGSGNLSWVAPSSQVAGAFVFTQSTPATTWVINHNLGYQYVNIQVIDSTGNSFTGRYNYPTITFNNTTHCTVTFDSAQAGYAAVTSGGGAVGPTGGSNTQVLFNDAGSATGISAFTYNKTTNTLSLGNALSVTGNANVGNLGTAQVLASANVTSLQLISNVATGTAPFVVSSTTKVANLNADTLDGYDTATANTASTIAVRDANGNLSANFFIGNGSQLTGIITSVSNVSNGNSNLNIPAANGNVNISVSGNANILVVTGTGVNVSGTLNTTGNANVGNIGATRGVFTNIAGEGGNISNIQGGNVSGAVASATSATNASALLQNTSTATTVYPTFTTSSANGNSSAVINTGISANLGNASITATTFVGALSGAATSATSATNAAAVQTNTSTSSTVYLAGVTSSSNGNSALNIVTGITANFASNTITATTFSGTLANGNSNVNIPAANGNVNITAVGNTTLVVTGTGANITGTLNTGTGNANVGNIGATRGVFTNVSGEGGNLSNIQGGNVSGAVASATAATNASAVLTNTSTNTTVYLTGTQSAANGNISLEKVTGIYANMGNNAITATTFVGALSGAATTAGTVTTAAQPNITSVGTLTSLAITSGAATKLTVTANAAPTSDMVVITNAGNAVTTAGVSGIQLTYVGGAAAVEASAYRTDLTPGATTGGTWNGFRMVATAGAASGVTMNAVKIDALAAAGAGGDNAIYVGANWDNIVNYNGTSVIYGNGIVNAAQVGANVASSNVANVANFTVQTAQTTGTYYLGLTNAATSGNVSLNANTNINVAIATGTLNTPAVSATGNITANNIISNTFLVVGVATGISAAGSTQGTATALAESINVVSTVTNGANGVSLPTAVAGYRITIVNTSANALNVYPLGNGIINSGAANAAYSQPAGARLDFICTAAATAPGGQWYTLNATYG